MKRRKLTDEEIIRLFNELKTGNEEVKDFLITYNYPLVLYYAENCKYNVPFEDKLSLSSYALINAVEKFDTSKGYKFSTYAISCMSHEINKYITRHLEKQPTVLFSLDEKVYNEGNNMLEIDKIPSNAYLEQDEIIERITNNEDLKRIYKAFKVLKNDEFIILIKFFGIGCDVLTQEEISKIVNKSQSTVSKKLKSGIQKIKNEVINDELEKRLVLR